MRDLRRYPVTIGEIEACLLQLSDEINSQELIGDMRPILLRTAAKIVCRSGFVMNALEDLR